MGFPEHEVLDIGGARQARSVQCMCILTFPTDTLAFDIGFGMTPNPREPLDSPAPTSTP